MRALWIFFFICCYGKATIAHYPKDFSAELSTIAFGSCNKQNRPQPAWKAILKQNLDLWIWMGDNIYGDSDKASVLKHKYQVQFNQPDYQAFRTFVPIIGTWDDHDYGRNNTGSWYVRKKASQQLALDFFEEPKDTERRKQEGIYTNYLFGKGKRRVAIFLLDVRYHAERRGSQGDLLGEAQWTWLEKGLEASEAQINLIVSGIQIIPEDHRFEKWANFPKSRARLFSLIAKHKPANLIILSGDRHIHEISRLQIPDYPTPLIEITSSGLTHSWTRLKQEKNRHRVGEFFNQMGFGILKIDWKNRILKGRAMGLDQSVAREIKIEF